MKHSQNWRKLSCLWHLYSAYQRRCFALSHAPNRDSFAILKKSQRKEKYGMCCFVAQRKLQANKKLLKDFQPSRVCLLLSFSLQYWSGPLTNSSFSKKVKKVGKNMVLIQFGWDKYSCCIVQLGHTAVLRTASRWEGCWYKPRLATKEQYPLLKNIYFPREMLGRWMIC